VIPEPFVPPGVVMDPPEREQCPACDLGTHAGCRRKGCGCACQEPAWRPSDLRRDACATCHAEALSPCIDLNTGAPMQGVHVRRRMAAAARTP
jgi:hypothetical protein